MMAEVSKTRGEDQKVRQGHGNTGRAGKDAVLETRQLPKVRLAQHSPPIYPHHPQAPHCPNIKTLG